ncbi:MAG: YggS family pyridoxal phosphate-dependent enzyme [Clostridiales bacterium]|nr:YggS family pyridoxal phosphate-dependent enzyme [Clostridiales bacterium]
MTGIIKENIERINHIKDEVALKAGRSKGEVLLCAVTKTRSVDEINEAIEAGITDIGENKAQEIMDKYKYIRPVRWHMIGHLQTNKVKYIIDKVDLIHSVDSKRLAEEINKRAAQHGKIMDILIQVNAAMEESKFGVAAEDAKNLIDEILASCPHIRIKGLMCMAPFEDDPKSTAVYFAKTKQLYDKYASEIQHERLDFSILSMGMSHDFEVAIQEGSNLIRIGTAIFGDRN